MTLTYDPKGPLAKLGVLEEVAKRDCPSRCHYVFNERGDIRGYFGNAFYSSCSENDGDGHRMTINTTRGAGQRGNLRIPRSELRSILLDALMSEASNGARMTGDGGDENHPISRVEILWNKRLRSYEDRPMMEKLNCSKGLEAQPAQQQQRPVTLHFEDGTTDQVDLLIGADGVNSVVARQYLSTSTFATQPKYTQSKLETAPRYLGIFIILGISDHFHPLIDERGFYTLDGNQRLFIMPFQGSRLDDEFTPTATSSMSNETDGTQLKKNQKVCSRRTMWQLSFPISERDEAMRLGQLSSEAMQIEVLKRCGHWHEPFPNIVRETPLETIWGTSLLDRDPQVFLDHRALLEIHGRVPSRVVVLGDAAHSMTPFKGQGANQAFADGPLLAKWLSKSKLDSAVRGFMTEMSNRSGIKVRASREAAVKLHSNDCWGLVFQQDKSTDEVGDVAAVFHGVETQHVSMLLRVLCERGVGASLGSKLDETIRGIIRELDIAETTSTNSGYSGISSQDMDHLQSLALEYASTGNMSQLRQLSRKSHLIIPNALDSHCHTCLHLAATHGHVDLCRWFLSEINMSCLVLDANGKSPIDMAGDAGNEETTRLLKRWIDQNGKSCENYRGIGNSAISAEATATDTKESNSGSSNGVKDIYRCVEQQLRGIRTEKQLCAMLKKNRSVLNHPITQVLGCHLDESDKEYDRQWMKTMAEEHGAVLLRNFIHREVDQLALGALALRPMNFDLSCALGRIRTGVKDRSFDAVATIGFTGSISKSEWKRMGKRIEETKSRMTIAADANVIVQTNFGPQMQSLSANTAKSDSASLGNAQKKQKTDSFSLSRLRYINVGEWNYNWGDRRYDKIKNASALPARIVSLAQQAHAIATGQIREGSVAPVPFDMAICNLYHLQRPSDRLGGHQDNVESNLSLPLVTISLGAPGIFLLGGNSRNDVPTAILLRSGDCLVMSGKSRGYFHGIPTILSRELDVWGCAATEVVEANVTVFP